MKPHYYTIHKNKKTKKAKYSKPYSKLQIKRIEECAEYFLNEIKKMKYKLLVK